MSIRVGTIRYNKGKKIYPSYPNYIRVEVMTASTAYGELGPYVLKDEDGKIMENIWQFAKVYPKVPATTQKYSRWDDTIIWHHPAEIHVDEKGELTPEYWNWREKGMSNEYPVRYPVGYSKKARASCLYAWWNEEKLDYIESREKIYLPLYTRLVKTQPKFNQLKEMLNKGTNLLIVEVDGPKQDSLNYYRQKYGVDNNFISNHTIEATEENFTIMLYDTRHPFGHGYCLAMALLDMEIE